MTFARGLVTFGSLARSQLISGRPLAADFRNRYVRNAFSTAPGVQSASGRPK
jgi:hypothetical protein